jgi:hypothetical protein
VTEPNQHPINQQFRPVNPHLEVDLKKQINKWLKHGVIEKSYSPWNFGLVAAPKKGGTIRWFVDYRVLNEISSISSAPIGNIEDNLARLFRSTVFSGINLIGAFHMIELKDKDKAKTAFATPWGSYQFVRMPFGLAGRPSSYARLVHMVLDGIPYTQALPYLDNTVIHSKDLAGHFLALDRVLEAYKKVGLKLQPAKCQLFQREIEYFRHLVSAKGIAPVQGYVQVVKDCPMPTNRSEVCTFLGKTGYYQRFMQNYAEVAGLLTDILKQDGTDDHAPFDQTSQKIKSFEQLKSNLLHAPILAYPRFHSKQPFILDTDWSKENQAIGSVLSQFQDGKEHVIAYGASKLTVAQSAYHSTKGEMAAAIIYIWKLKYYLQHCQFILRIDNAAMQWIRTLVEPVQGMVQRWQQTLANNKFDVVHRLGRNHGNADALSRAPYLIEDPTLKLDISMGENIGAMICSLQSEEAWTLDLVHKGQEQDEELAEVRKWVLDQSKPTNLQQSAPTAEGKKLAGLFESLYLDKDRELRYDFTYGQEMGLL